MPEGLQQFEQCRECGALPSHKVADTNTSRTPTRDDPLPKLNLTMCTLVLPSNGSGLGMEDGSRAYEEGLS